MQRSIKFRAWDKEKKWMLAPIVSTYHFGEKGFQGIEYRSGKPVFLQANHVFLMQFTGLLDKNGKEIYEGDIKEYGKAYHTVIEFKDGVFEEVDTKDKNNRTIINKYSHLPSEIIGNVHETPEKLHNI